MGSASERDSAMNKDETVIRGSEWRMQMFFLGAWSIGLLATAILMPLPLDFVLYMTVGGALGVVIGIFLSASGKKYCLVIRARDLEGPVRSGICTVRRTVPLSEVDLAASRPPGWWKQGYLQLSDGSRIVVHSPYFNARQAADIVSEICRRQQGAEPGESR